MERKESIENIRNIRKLIANYEKINDMDFRIILEGLIKKGDDNSEYAVIQYMRSIEVEVNVRLNIIRAVGYLNSPSFLEPLKKLIEVENNVNIKKESILAISKYNDRRALNILNLALKDLRNSILLQTLNNEIGKIKQNNPILTLMPRFINEKDNKKSFRVTIDILKRILSEEDSRAFLKFLSFNEKKIQDAAFEILCSTGPLQINETLYDFFLKRGSEIDCKQDDCEEFLSIIKNIYKYLSRFPEFIEKKLLNLENIFSKVSESNIRKIILNIISISMSDTALAILERIYDKYENFREEAVAHLGKNPKSLDFLYEVYKSSSIEIEKIVPPLMLIDDGIKYFFENFNEKNHDEQEIILKYFPLYHNPYYVDFCRDVLKSTNYNLKIMLLEKIKEKGEFSVKDILFDPDNEKEFLLMEKEYLSTILKLFPVSAVKKIFELIVFEEFSVLKTKRFLKIIEPVMSKEIVFDFSDPPILNFLSNRIINMNNSELYILFLSVFSNIKVINPKSFDDLNVALNIFINQRGSKTNVKEKYEIRKIKENITNLSIIKKRMEGMGRAINILKSIEFVKVEKITSLIQDYPSAIPLFINELTELIESNFVLADFNEIPGWINLFNVYPQIAIRVKDTILSQSTKYNKLINIDLKNVYRNVPEKSRIILKFQEKDLISMLLDQFSEILPDVEIVYMDCEINNTDILFCDAESFSTFTKKSSFPTEYLFLFLNKISEFSAYKSYNPRFFVKPYSFARIIRDILKELFLINGNINK